MIAARLAIMISAAERRRALAENAPDLHAYGLILRGQDLSLRYRKEANLHARRLFEHAAEIDPAYGRCYAGMSRTFNLAWRYRWIRSPKAALDKAVELAVAAIAHDALDARGYGELGFAQLYKKHHGDSLAAYQRAIKLNPNDADLLAEMGDALQYVGQSGACDRALETSHEVKSVLPGLVFVVSWRCIFRHARLRTGDRDAPEDAGPLRVASYLLASSCACPPRDS